MATLNRMAKSHTKTMLVMDCLKHMCGSELSPQERLKKSGYLDGAASWNFAEDLGYESTAKRIVARWLSTSLVRHSLLSPKYVDVGIGPAAGAPDPGVNDASFVAYTVDLASRKPRR